MVSRQVIKYTIAKQPVIKREGTSSPGGLKICSEFNWKKKSSKEATLLIVKFYKNTDKTKCNGFSNVTALPQFLWNEWLYPRIYPEKK